MPTLFVFNISSQSVAIVASQMLLCKTNVYKVKKCSKSRVW